METLAALDMAQSQFEQGLRRVRHDQWTMPTHEPTGTSTKRRTISWPPSAFDLLAHAVLGAAAPLAWLAHITELSAPSQ
jgi:hypothetical protein